MTFDDPEEKLGIIIVFEDGPSVYSSQDDMIDAAFRYLPSFSRQG